ncbi:MAG: translocation/assembly module TamB domain-containing protein [Inhella sp.]
MKRALRGSLLLLLLALAVLAAVLLWSQQASGLRFWLARAGVQTEGLQGSFWNGLRIEQLRWQGADGTRLELRGLQWQREGLSRQDGRWHLQGRLGAQRLALQTGKPGTEPLRPEALLQSLRLPLDLSLSALKVQELSLDGQHLQGLSLQLQARQDPLWVVRLAPLSLAKGSAQGQARLQANGQLSAQARWQVPGFDPVQLQAQGSLAVLRLQAQFGPAAQAQAELQPLATQPLQQLRLQLEAFDLRRLHPQWPHTALSGELQAQVDAQQVAELQARLSNQAALRLDQDGWPVRALEARLRVPLNDWRGLRVQALALDLGEAARSAGRLALKDPAGLPAQARWQADLSLQPLRLNALHAGWPAAQIGGALALERAQDALELRLQGQLQPPGKALGIWQLQAQTRLLQLQPTQFLLSLQGPAGQQLNAEVKQTGSGLWQAQARSQGEWPLPALGPWPAQRSPLQAELKAELALPSLSLAALRAASGQAQLQLQPGTRWLGLPLEGQATWQRAQAGLPAQASLQVQAPASLALTLQEQQKGWMAGWQPLQARAQVDELATLRAWWQPWLQEAAGRLRLQAEQQGGTWQAEVDAGALRLRLPQQARWQLESLQGRGRLDAQALQAELSLRGLEVTGQRLSQARFSAQGPLEAQAWRLDAEGRSGTQDWRVAGQAQGRWNGSQQDWQALQLDAGPNLTSAWLQLREGALSWQPAAGAWNLGPATLQLLGEPLQLQQARYAAEAWQLRLQGQPRLAPWLRAATGFAWEGDLRTQLEADLQGQGSQLSGRARLSRIEGDLSLPDDAGQPHALALRTLDLQAQRLGEAASLSLQLASQAHGELQLQLGFDAAEQLSGRLQARLPTLQALEPWLQGGLSGLRLRGRAEADLRISGQRSLPLIHGPLRVQELALQHPASGFATQDGQVELRFEGAQARLVDSHLGGQPGGTPAERGGQLLAAGQLNWQADAQADLQLQAQAWRVLQRYDRQLVLSGKAQLRLRPGQLGLQGGFTVDQGRFDLGRADAPVLGEDVRVLRAGTAPVAARGANGATAWQPQVDLRLDLGQRLTVRGRGLQTRATGQLRLQMEPGKPSRWSGQIESNGGRYRAYGQDLEIETGVLSFDKAGLDNPRLDLLAVRPDMEQRVGVRVDGRAQNPRVRLYSEPVLSDTEVLSWLLLGRAPDELGSSDAALLQRAALALLAGEGENPASELMGKLGLTEVSLSPNDEGERVLRVGAQLGRRWSLAYERSLGQAAGSWQLAYRLGQRFTLRARSGEDSGVDGLWVWKFD